MLQVRQIEDSRLRADICEAVMRALPDWFGNESATLGYINKAKSQPFFSAYSEDTPVGFVYFHIHNQYTAELCCMGVLIEHHRRGAGSEDYGG